MGHFVDGQWHSGWYGADRDGRFERPPTTFREPVMRDGTYHLYFSYACPWAHRTLLACSLLKLAIPKSPVHWLLTDDGWAFREDCHDALYESHWLRELYLKADPMYTGRVTVPVLWDPQRETIVNNESREILRGLTSGTFLSPTELQPAIDAMLDRIYPTVNNGVYRCGFAHSQGAYDEAVGELFAELDHLEEILGSQRYLCGETLTEADLCLFTTLLRFDPVYVVHFKCSRRRIADYPHLSRFLADVRSQPGVEDTVRLDHIRNHYFQSHRHINPLGLVATPWASD